jgi:hypothetical protein
LLKISFNRSITKQQQSKRGLRNIRIMRHHDDRLLVICRETAEQIGNAGTLSGIQVPGRFVCQENCRLNRKSASYSNPLLLAS